MSTKKKKLHELSQLHNFLEPSYKDKKVINFINTEKNHGFKNNEVTKNIFFTVPPLIFFFPRELIFTGY